MSKIEKNDLEVSEDVELQSLKEVWTVGRKFMFAIVGGLLLIVLNGVFALYYSSKIVNTSDLIIDHTYKMKDIGSEVLININKHKAALAAFTITKDNGIRTEVVDIRSKLLELNSSLKQEAISEEEEKRNIKISEQINTILNYGQDYLDKVEGFSKTENEDVAPVVKEVVPEVVASKPKNKAVKPKAKKKIEKKESLDLDALLEGLDDLSDLGGGSAEKTTKNDALDDLSALDDLEGLSDIGNSESNTSTKNEEKVILDFDMGELDFSGSGEVASSEGPSMREYNLAVLECLNLISDQIIIVANSNIKIQKEKIKDNYLIFKVLQIILILMLIGYFLGLFYFFNKGITQPIKNLRKYLMSMGRGELPDFKMKVWKDDIGEMIRAVKELLIGLKSTASFAKELGQGNLEAEYSMLSKHDVLGNALIDMRDNLRNLATEDEKRNWVNQGVASFAGILRTNNDNLDVLTDQIVLYLVNYLKVNQGAIFLVNDTNKKDVHLELASIYAWDRKKFVEEKIEKGQGLVGQCWYEQKTIFMTDVPNDFIKITSGLGAATPNCILILPLIANEEMYGVLEFASFRILEKFEIDYLEKVAENIAAAIGNVRITEQTKILLGEAQQQGEELRANEEEMRQNMEEMNATQEEMDRVLRDKDIQIERLTKELDALKN